MESIEWTATGEGILLGFGLAFLIGPAFFALLQASIDYGFTVSVAIAAGVVISDILLMNLSYFALKPLSAIPHFHDGLSVVGGCVLIGTGITSMISKPATESKENWKLREFGKLFMKGFSINTFNPFPWMFWFSTSALVQTEFGATGTHAPFFFFAAAAITVFSTDVLKAGAAHFLLRFLTQSVLKWFKIISGLCLIGFGLKLLWMVIG